MAEHAVTHGVAPAPGGSHASDQDHILQSPKRTRRVALVPPAVVHPLPQQLDGRLRKVFLPHGHVEIVDEYRVFFTHRRPEHAFPPFVHLRV